MSDTQYGAIEREQNSERGDLKTRRIVASVSIFLILVTVIAVSIYATTRTDDVELISSAGEESIEKYFDNAVVAVDGAPCAKIGADILKEGGSAVDAAVAALFCNGVFNCHSMGIGGGFLMTIFDAKTKEVVTLNAREVAPALSNVHVFGNDSDKALKGPLSVAVPGEINGYFKARQRFGNKSISWRRIIQPTIDLCRNGIPVSFTLEDTISDYEFEDDLLRKTFTDSSTGEPWKQGDVYTREELAVTLDKLAEAEDGMNELFYRGEIAELLVKDLEKLGGVLSMKDMRTYEAEWVDPVTVHLKSSNLTLYSVPPPGSGAVLGAILNILDQFENHQEDVLFFHRLVESFKFAYGQRSKLGDPKNTEFGNMINKIVNEITSDEWARMIASQIQDNMTFSESGHYGGMFYNVQDKGTAHLSILAADGSAVSVTSTINQEFGSGIMSPSTGIIYNDEMDDFSYPGFYNGFNLPPSPSNLMSPGRRPMSSMAPSIFLDPNNKVKLIQGAAGGSRITTANALVFSLNVWLNKTLKESIDYPRLHHQLEPNTLEYQSQFSKEILEGLVKKGHKIHDRGSAGSTMTGVEVAEDGLHGVADYRKAGNVDGY